LLETTAHLLEELFTLLRCEKSANPEERTEALLVGFRPQGSDRVDLLEHGGLVGLILLEQRTHLLVSVADLSAEIAVPIPGGIGDLVHASQRLLVEIEALDKPLELRTPTAGGTHSQKGRATTLGQRGCGESSDSNCTENCSE
jgi:hypothetical protein